MPIEPKLRGGEPARFTLALRALNMAIVGASAFLLLLFLYAAMRRLRYPYDIEWIESGMMIAVLRLLHGQPLYTAPTPDYVPYIYAPLFFYVAAAMSKLTGPTMAALRAVSIVSTLGSCAAIYLFVLTETRRRIPAIAAAGLFAGCYAIAAQFYDIGRVDSLFVFLLLLALLAQRRGHPIAAAVLWALTAQTKQTVLPLAVLILCAEWQAPRRLAAALGTFLVLSAAAIGLENHFTHGWYGFYIFHVATGLSVLWRQAALFLPNHLLAPFGIALLITLGAFLQHAPTLRSARSSFYAFVSVALIGGTWFVAGHAGASANALMPVYAWVAILFGVGLGRVLNDAGPRLTAFVLTAAVVQLMALTYNPGQYIPPPQVRASRAEFIEQLREIPGNVDLVDHSYDAVLAGKEPQAEGEAFGAVVDSHAGAPRTDFLQAYAARFNDHAYTAVVVDAYPANDSSIALRQNYSLAVPAFAEDHFFLTSQPHLILFPCSSAALAAGVPHPDEIDSHRCTQSGANTAPALP